MLSRGTWRFVMPWVVCVLLLHGCGQADPDGVVATAKRRSASEAAGRQLSEQQVRSALLRVPDLATGWKRVPNDPADGDLVVEPARCEAVLNASTSALNRPGADGERTFHLGGPLGTDLTETIESYPDEVGDGLDGLWDALGSCPRFSFVEDGVGLEVELSPMEFADFGDEVIGFSLVGDANGVTVVVLSAIVVVGHNVLSFASVDLGGADRRDLQKVVQAGMERLEKAVAPQGSA